MSPLPTVLPGRWGPPKIGSMPDGRPAIPADLQRRVLMEAGHRCAIPTCRTTPVELAHIVPWSEVRGHTFENLIALCPTCHTRYDTHQIDRLSMKGYKANLGLVSGRYGEIERRILDQLAITRQDRFRLPGGWDIPLMYLLRDGLIVKAPFGGGVIINGLSATDDYLLTTAGQEFIKRWVTAEAVSPELRIAVTIRDGRIGAEKAPDGKGRVLAVISYPGFLDEGDKIRLADGTDVIVIGVEETLHDAGSGQTVFVGSAPPPPAPLAT